MIFNKEHRPHFKGRRRKSTRCAICHWIYLVFCRPPTYTGKVPTSINVTIK